MGMVVVKTNEELIREEKEREQSLLNLRKKEIPSLVAHLHSMWQDAKRAKKPIEDRILENERLIKGEYSPEKLRQIRELGGSEAFMMITEVKTRNFEAWVRDIYQQPGGVPWDIEPTPIPELPKNLELEVITGYINDMSSYFINKVLAQNPEANVDDFIMSIRRDIPELRGRLKRLILEKAREATKEMKNQMEDQLQEGGWYEAFHELIQYIAIKCGFLKGPVLRKTVREIIETDEKGNTRLVAREEIIPTWEAIHPRFIYPQPGVSDIQRGYLFELIPYTPADIQQFIGLPNFDEDEIRAVLRECQNGKLREWTEREQEWAEIEGQSPDMIHEWERVDCLNFWGAIQGRMLHEFDESLKESCPDEDKYYHIEAYLIGNHIIKLVLNQDPNGLKPYSKCSFKEDGSFFGVGLPEIIEDVQTACNACARALINNVGMASGPQVVINEDMLSQFEKGNLIPWKRWFTTNDQMATGKAIEFYQPTLIGQQLISVFQFFLKLADEHSGVPAYAHGDPQVGGAGNTASGLSMLMAQSARGIKLVIKNIDEKIIEDSIERLYKWNLRRKKFANLIGDVKIKARGSLSLIAKEQQIFRLNELLSIISNEIDMSIIGKEGRKKLLKQIFQAYEMDPNEIIGDIERIYSPIEAPQEAIPMRPGVAPLPKPAVTTVAGMPAGGEESRLITGRGGPVEMP